MRVSVPLEDLVEALTPEPALTGAGGGRGGGGGGRGSGERAGSTSNVDAIRLSRARTVPS
jgi:hypothetical protein